MKIKSMKIKGLTYETDWFFDSLKGALSVRDIDIHYYAKPQTGEVFRDVTIYFSPAMDKKKIDNLILNNIKNVNKEIELEEEK